MTPHRIVILGGGFSGSITSCHLMAQNYRYPVETVIAEQSSSRLYGGIAYSTETAGPRLHVNQPAKHMSAFSREPYQLVDWLEKNDYLIPKFGRAIRRNTYQHYIEAQARRAAAATSSAWLKKRFDEAVSLQPQPWGLDVKFSSGQVLPANAVVVATGFPVAKEAPFTASIAGSSRYVPDTHCVDGRTKIMDIGRFSTAFILGTGLTAFDTAFELLSNGHAGPIIMASRGGHYHKPLRQRSWRPVERVQDFFLHQTPKFVDIDDPARMMKGIVSEFKFLNRVLNIPSYSILEEWEAFAPTINRNLGQDKTRSLLSEYASLITTNRVGIDSQVFDTVMGARNVKILSTDVLDMEKTPAGTLRIIHRTRNAADNSDPIEADCVISCLGRETIAGPLWKNLLEQKLASRHFTGHGVEVDNDGRLNPAHAIYTVGACRAGDTMMKHGLLSPVIVGVPGIRDQPKEVAENIAYTLQNHPPAFVPY